jgi:putative ABC transport system ATP-binding protein
VADEPTGSLDSRTSEAIFQLFETLVSSGKTILMVTHDIDLATRSTRTIIVSDGKVMNEYIKTALPYLDLDQLLDTSAKFEAQTYNPGDLILRKGERSHYFYIITAGEVEVLLDAGSGHQIPVARLHSGQYFGEMQLIQGGGATANVRAGSAGVEVLRLDETGFYYLLEESAITQHTIERVVRERNMQNWLVGERDTSFHD